MNNDVKLVITATFGVVVLAWVLINASAVQTVSQAAATSYSTALKALLPQQG